MRLNGRALPIACLFVALVWAGPSQAVYYSLQPGSGEQFWLSRGRPLPQVFTTTGGTAGWVPTWTGTMFPPLLIPPNADPAKALIQQSPGPDPKKMTVPPGAFRRPAPGPTILGVALLEPTLFQVKTNIEFSGPGLVFGSAVFQAGGRTGAPTTTFTGVPSGASIRYTATAAQFGGPSRTQVVPASAIEVWAHGPGVMAMAPCKHPVFGGPDAECVAVMVESQLFAVAGATAGLIQMTPGGFVMTEGVRAVSVPAATGLIAMSKVVAMTGPISNMATSAGFPWTTGVITISQPNAVGIPEVFMITGMDSRVGGVGTISLVSGALSERTVSGSEANRGWARYTLPEPGALLGAAAAFAMLGVCHRLVRRRSHG